MSIDFKNKRYKKIPTKITNEIIFCLGVAIESIVNTDDNINTIKNKNLIININNIILKITMNKYSSIYGDDNNTYIIRDINNAINSCDEFNNAGTKFWLKEILDVLSLYNFDKYWF